MRFQEDVGLAKSTEQVINGAWIKLLKYISQAQRGLGKPETFKFLGFTHICGRSKQGKFHLRRKTRRELMRTKLQEIKEELRRRMPPEIDDIMSECVYTSNIDWNRMVRK